MSISKEFVLAGEAVFTIETPTAGQHYTFRVVFKPENPPFKATYFVSLFTGGNNGDPDSYTYLGILDTYTFQVRTTRATARNLVDSFSLRLLNRILARVECGDHAAYERHGYHTHHEGQCGRCGRALTHPVSIETGIGPECARKIGVKWEKGEGDEAEGEGEGQEEVDLAEVPFEAAGV